MPELAGTLIPRALVVLLALAGALSPAAVTTSEGTVTIPTYVHSGRETEPALFANSTVTGLYPFTTYLMPFEPDGPKPRSYRAIFLENEYLKLTYIPDFGGRIFSLYDKLRGRETFYRNDVVKPAHYNPRSSWPQSGLELTGPYDAHMLTLYGEPFWSNKIVRNSDGSISLVLGETDPVYHMKVNLTATLHPGVAALQMSVFCYNPRPGRMPQMFWISASLPATAKTRFIYPMTRTIGHTTSEIAGWPVYNGADYSWDRNNKHMLGVFGIDIYDNFQGAYHFDQDYGVFRYADRRIVQGMKLWTFGYGPGSKNLEHGYTDNAGPYIEVQSGRHVWDGHYEWVGPHATENWSEWWVPVAGIGGLTTLTRDVALNLDGNEIALSATRAIPGAKLTAGHLNTTIDLLPGKPVRLPAKGPLTQLTVTDSSGRELLHYERPSGKEYTPFTRPLEKPAKPVAEMGVEELVLAAEFKFKELNDAAGMELLEKAFARDPGYSRAHLVAGIHHFNAGRYQRAAVHLEKSIDRDPYLDEAYYYLAMTQFALGDTRHAERNLYYIWPLSRYYGHREYHLGRLAFLRSDLDAAAAHLERAMMSNGYDLNARLLLAVVWRAKANNTRALEQFAAIDRIDPTNRPALAERMFLGQSTAKAELVRLMGGQSQEAMDVALFYRGLERWGEAVEILRLVERDNHDVYGAPAEFYYTMAYCLKRAGQPNSQYLRKARAAAANIDRFPYREESEAVLLEAAQADPADAVARYLLGCLLYHRERPAEAIRQWEAAVQADPRDFHSRRALGLASADAAQLEKATELNPAHVPTLNDLSGLYAKAGRFDEQLAVLRKALARSPQDDNLAEAVLTANLIKGRYDEADRLVSTHRFAPRHRTYGLRDKFRFMRYAMASAAFREGRYDAALKLFESALKPPVELGVDDFASQTTPRLDYYLGRALEALGRTAESRQAYERAVQGMAQLTGDRDSWNSENFYIVPALEKLGRAAEAAKLAPRFEAFARGELDSKSPRHRAEARYLLALFLKHAGAAAESRKLLDEALALQPDFLPPRLDLL